MSSMAESYEIGWQQGYAAGLAESRRKRDEELRAAVAEELRQQRGKPDLMRSSGYEGGLSFVLALLAPEVKPIDLSPYEREDGKWSLDDPEPPEVKP